MDHLGEATEQISGEQAKDFSPLEEEFAENIFHGGDLLEDSDGEEGIVEENNNKNILMDGSSETSVLEQSGGRDSGISTESSARYQEFFSKCCQIEDKIQERVLASQQELQEAKRRLEELRLLRFEEKTVLRQEIEQLYEKVDVEENRTTELSERLKNVHTEKLIQSQKLSDLNKEQEIGSQINMMQEQEIVRLEMKLKEEEYERGNLAQQLDQHRRTIIDKDKTRLKHQGEIYILKERITQLEESNLYYKNESDVNYRKARECDQSMLDLKSDITKLERTNDDSMVDLTNVTLQIKVLENEKMKLMEKKQTSENECEDLTKKLEDLMKRLDVGEKDFKSREEAFQQDLDNASLTETKLLDRCDELEALYHNTRREKDEQYFELTQVEERATALEQRVKEVEDEKTDLEFDLSELRNALCRHVKSLENNQKSPTKADANDNKVDVKELENYFTENTAAMYRYQCNIDDLSIQIENERTIVGELNVTINDLRGELDKAQNNMKSISSLKETLQCQQQRTSDTLKIQEKDLERKAEENEQLREIINDYERKLVILETEVHTVSDERKLLSGSHKEERRRLKARIHELETQKQLADTNKRKSDSKFQDEKEILDEQLGKKRVENEELKKEMEKLIEDNKSLAKRLMHLESYSSRLNDLLEQQQNSNQKLKDKVQKEMRQMKNESGDKEMEIGTLKNQLDDLNRSLSEKQENEERLGHKLKYVKDGAKDAEKKKKDLEEYNEELQKRLDLVNEAHIKAERKAIAGSEDVSILKKRLEDQKKAMEDLFQKIKGVEHEKSTLKENLQNSEKRIQMKEELVVELTKKTGQAADNFNSLRHTLETAELEGKQYEKRFIHFRQNQVSLEKALNESEAEKHHLSGQVSNLQRLLAKSEDEKDLSLTECSRYQRQLEAERSAKQMLNEKREQSKQKDFDKLQDQIISLRTELGEEKKRRERLEDLYNKRDDQVSQLRTTFDQSLNTISKDTKNIKSILGKSLKKIDRDIIGENESDDGDVTSSERTFGDSDYSPSTRLSGSHYLNLPRANRSKSVETPVEEIRHKYSTPKMATPSPSSAATYARPLKASPIMISSNIPHHFAHAPAYTLEKESPVRDLSYSSRSKTNKSKRYSK